VYSSPPAVVGDPLIGVVSGRHQQPGGVGGEPGGTLEGGEISYSNQKLRSKKRSRTR
jgi:hypothetical protein